MLMSLLSKINVIGENIDLICPVCLFIVRDKVDLENLAAENCCTECYDNFRFTMSSKWEEGDRPDLKTARGKLAKRHN